MNIVLATLSAHAAHRTDVETVLRRLLSATAREPGARGYFVSHDPLVPGRFTVYERYSDATARDAHFESQHLREALAQLEPWLSQAPLVTFLDEVAAFSEPRASSILSVLGVPV